MQMKVAQVDVNFGSSSTGKIVADLVSGLERRGHHVKAYFGRGPASPKRATKISRPWEVGAHVLVTRLTGLTDGFSPLATRRLIADLERLDPDVVHLHDIHGYFVNIAQLCDFLKRRGVATVWTFHSEFMYTGRCGYAMECERWRTGCASCPDLSRYPTSWFFDFAGKMFEGKRALFNDFERLSLVSPSRWLATRMGESLVGERPVEVVPNGLDTSVFRSRDVVTLRSEMGLQGKYCVLALGSGLLSERKGGRWVIELAKRFAGEDVVFLMVGVDQIPSLLPSNVIMHPRISDQNRLAEFYSLCDVLVLPSEKETFSMVSAEALACGLHVIGFDSGAPKEVAPPGYGSFVPYGDLDGLETLLRNVRQGLGGLLPRSACVEFARNHYSAESMVSGYEAIYKKLIQCK